MKFQSDSIIIQEPSRNIQGQGNPEFCGAVVNHLLIGLTGVFSPPWWQRSAWGL